MHNDTEDVCYFK